MSSAHAINCANYTGHISVNNITLTGCLVVVHIDAFQLQIAVTSIVAFAIDAMLFGDDFPELRRTDGMNKIMNSFNCLCG